MRFYADGWLAGWLVATGRSSKVLLTAGWLPDWLAGSLVGWLAGYPPLGAVAKKFDDVAILR